jgi:hypothetical protein
MMAGLRLVTLTPCFDSTTKRKSLSNRLKTIPRPTSLIISFQPIEHEFVSAALTSVYSVLVGAGPYQVNLPEISCCAKPATACRISQ